MDSQIVASIKSVFRKYDSNGDGYISKGELRTVIQAIQGGIFQDTDLEEVFKVVDTNKDGRIQYAEFVDWLADDSQSFTDIARPAPSVVHAAVSEAVENQATGNTSSRDRGADNASGILYRAGAPIASRPPVAPDIVLELDGEELDFHEVMNGLRMLTAKQLRGVFQDADIDKNGHLQLDELRRLVFPSSASSLGLEAASALTKVFAQMDKNADGKIGCGELVAFILQAKQSLGSVASEADKRQIAAAFGKADADSSGNVSVDELQAVLGANTTEERSLVSQAFEACDQNADGTLSVLEFSHVYGKELIKEKQALEVKWNDVPDEDSD